MKQARTAQNLANTSGSLNATSNTSPSNGRSLSRLYRILKSDEAMQPTQDGKALDHHQSGTGNTSQTKLTSFYLKKQTNKQTNNKSKYSRVLPSFSRIDEF